MRYWVIFFFWYFVFWGVFELIVRPVLSKLYYKITGKEKADLAMQRELRITRVEIFAKRIKKGDFGNLMMVDSRTFGYENGYHMWQELSDHAPSLLEHFYPLGQANVGVGNADK